MDYQYQQFPSEPSINEQYSSTQPQPQTVIQMQEMNPNMQNQPNYEYPPIVHVGQPITSYPYQSQPSNYNQYQQPQQNNVYPQMQQFVQQPAQQYMLVPIKSPQQKLADCHGIFVKQKLEVFEAITGCETENSYKVFQADVNGTQVGDQPIFNCKEKSNCCHRQCLAGSCRPFRMDVVNENGMVSNNGQLTSTPFLHFERPFKCTMCCYERPELSITCNENGQSVFYGTLKNPFMCLELGCEVYDRSGILKYVIMGSCCQLGFLCRQFPCQSCQEYLFEVKSPSGEILTRLQKKSAGCLKASISNADNFALGFPPNSTVEEKILLMAATLFMDYMYFEDKKKQKRNNFQDSFISQIL